MTQNDRHVLLQLSGLAESIIGEQGTLAVHRTMHLDQRVMIDGLSNEGDVRMLATDLYQKIDRVLVCLGKGLPLAAFGRQRAELEAANTEVVNRIQRG